MSTKFLKIPLLFLFFLLVPVDALNGLFASLGWGIPVSATFKSLLLVIYGYKLLSRKRSVHKMLAVTAIMILYILWHWGISGNEFLGHTISMLIRVMLFYVIYSYYSDYFSRVDDPAAKLLPLFKASALTVTFVLLLGLLGFGSSSYGDEGIGSKGYFIAGNEVSALLLVLYSFVLFSCKGRKKSFVIWSCLFLLSAWTISTKMAILSSIISIIYLGFFVDGRKVKTKLFILASLMAAAIYKIIDMFSELLNIPLIDRWNYLYQDGGLLKLVFSNRNEYLDAPLAKQTADGFFAVFLGKPYVSTVEMDPFDTFLHFGVIGCIIVYGGIFLMMLKAHKYAKINQYNRFVLFTLLLLFAASSIAGHIVYSGMMLPFLALVVAAVYVGPKRTMTSR